MRTIAVSFALLAITACGGGSAGSGAGSFDSVPPTLSVTLDHQAVVAGGTLVVTFVFSEPVVGFSSGDAVISQGTPGAFSQVNPTTYTLGVTASGTGATSVDISVGVGAYADALGNHNLVMSTQHAAIAYAVWATSSGSDTYGPWADLSISGNGETATQRFRLIPPNAFIMGSPSTEAGREYRPYLETQHTVTLTSPAWIADSECTQRMFKSITNSNPSFFTADGLNLPVDQVSYLDTQAFLTAINVVIPSLGARLPTEAEWECACRAGTTTPHAFSPVNTASINCTPWSMDAYISTGTTRAKTVAVKSLVGNPWGFYEMHANLEEWCADWYAADLGSSPVTDPMGPPSGSDRVLKGGDWDNAGGDCRSAVRGTSPPTLGLSLFGFRIAASVAPSGGG